MGTEIMRMLLAATAASSLALLVVLAVRQPLRAWAGSGAVYGLWACVPVALLALAVPGQGAVATAVVVDWQPVTVALQPAAPVQGLGWAAVLAWIWGAGSVLAAMRLAGQQWRFQRSLGPLRRRDDGTWQAGHASVALPAVAGLLRPRILLPADFDTRFGRQEQALVLEHERQHLRRGDLHANAVAAGLRCVFWFNPLVHLAWRCFQHDQELACDAAVVSRHPQGRRHYGQAMLKAHAPALASPLGCHWQATHPLQRRIQSLARPLPALRRRRLAALVVLGLASATGLVAWAAQPPAQAAAATPASSAPAYEITVGMRVGDEQRSFGLRAGNGQTVGLRDGGNGRPVWEVSLTPSAGPSAGTAWISARISVDGRPAGEPRLLVELGKTAGIGLQGDAGASPVGLVFAVRELAASSATPVAAQASAPPRQPASATVKMPPPRYPREAAQAGVSGRVMLVVEVAADGSVTAVDVEEAQPQGVFEAVSIEAARQWRFQPAMDNGVAVPGRLRVPVTFELDPDAVAAQEG
jgi:bla regulator protein BlaR1